MKKIINISIITAIIIMVTAISVQAEWIHSEKANGWLYIDRVNNEFVKNAFFWIRENEVDPNSLLCLYHFNKYGFLETSKKINDDYSANEKGQILNKIGEIIKTQNPNTTTNTSNIINATGKEIINDTAGSNEIKTKKDDDGSVQIATNTGRLLKNYITEMQGVEIVKEKTINGNKKTNVIYFKENGSLISVDTKKYNKISLKLERDKTTSDLTYELRLVVNGLEEDVAQFEDDEFELECEFEYNLNDDVDLVMYQYGGENSWGSKGIYITNGRMAKHQEDE